MQGILDKLTWGLLLLFALPTVMIVASWNALPGDTLFGTKLALENTLLVMARPSYAAEGTLNVKYTERRFSEAKRLLADRQSVQGLSYLSQQITATKAVIERAPNPEARRELAQTYIQTLTTVVSELETQKQDIARESGATIAYRPSSASQPPPAGLPAGRQGQQPVTVTAPRLPTPTPTHSSPPAGGSSGQAPTARPTPTPTQIFVPPAATAPQTPAPPPQEVVDEIEDTQEEIERTIEEISQFSAAEAAHERNEERREEREEDRDERRNGEDNRGRDEDRENQGRGNNDRD